MTTEDMRRECIHKLEGYIYRVALEKSAEKNGAGEEVAQDVCDLVGEAFAEISHVLEGNGAAFWERASNLVKNCLQGANHAG